MPQRGLTRHDFFIFEGVNAYREGNRIPKNALFYAENSRFFGGRWSSRKGYSKFGSVLDGGTNIKGLLDYQRFPGGNAESHLVAYYGSDLQKYDMVTQNVTEIATAGWTAGDVEIEGVSYNSALYLVNGVDRIGKLDNNTFSVLPEGAPRLRLIETWAEKMFGVDNTAPSTALYTSTASASEPENIEDWTTVDSAGAQLIGKGGRIESLKKLNEKLYTFKKDQIDVFTSFILDTGAPIPVLEPISKNTGAINNRAVVIVENDIWFLTPNLEIRSLGQESGYFQETRTEDMSAILKRYKNSLDLDQSGAVAWYNDGIYKLALKERGSSQNNVIFVYERETGGWSFDRSTAIQVVTIVDGKAYFGLSGNSGLVYQDETGYTENGQPMVFTGKTGLVDDGRPDLNKHARYLFVRGARSANVVITIYLLGEDFERLQSFTVEPPTDEEIALGGNEVGGLNRQVGDIVGEEGFVGEEVGAPPVYRFNVNFSCVSNDRMFGMEVVTVLNGQRVFIDEAKLKYIPRSEKYYSITS